MLQVKELEAKIEVCKQITNDLWRDVVPSCKGGCDDARSKYYAALKEMQSHKKALNQLLDEMAANTSIKQEHKTQAAIEVEEKRAAKEASVTSLTHERWKARVSKQVEGFISGKSSH
jgi:enoyl reductase-like protein